MLAVCPMTLHGLLPWKLNLSVSENALFSTIDSFYPNLLKTQELQSVFVICKNLG